VSEDSYLNYVLIFVKGNGLHIESLR